MLFQSGRRTFRRPAQHQLPLRHELIAHPRPDLELPKVANLGQLFGLEQNLFLRSDGSEKLHCPDGGEQKKRRRIFRKTGSGGDAGGLGERFRQDNPGDERIAGKMAGEQCIVGSEDRRALGVSARFAGEQLPNEYERRPMGEKSDKGQVISDG